MSRFKGPAPFLVIALFLILAYQNFSLVKKTNGNQVSSENLNPRFHQPHIQESFEQSEFSKDQAVPLEETHHLPLQSLGLLSQRAKQEGNFDIREFAPLRPNHVAFNEDPFRAPNVHTPNMNDVGSVWLEREMRPLVKPIEDEWLRQVNGRLRHFVGTFKPVDGEDWPESGGDEDSPSRGPASDPSSFPGMPNIPGLPDYQGTPDSGEAQPSGQDYFSWNAIAPEDVKLTKANEVTIAFRHGTNVSCEINSSQNKFRLSRPISRSSSLDFSHESAENRNSVGFRLSW